jgi:hypothetical protein
VFAGLTGTVRVFTMDSAVLGLGPEFGIKQIPKDPLCTVRVFRQGFTLEDAIEFHAFAPLQASKRATNGILFHSGIHSSYRLAL